jgi:archaellum component FlaC
MEHQSLIWSLAFLIVANLLGVWRVNAAQNKRFDERFIKSERHVNIAFANVSKQFNDMTNQITKILEGDIRELRGKVDRLDNNLETSRSRVHDLGNEMNTIILKVDRLERAQKT